MRDGIQGLGWFVRRTDDPLALADFYISALGLPELRRWDVTGEEGAMLYAGDVGVLEINIIGKGGVRPLSDSTPETAPCTPIFRCHGVASVSDHCLVQGATLIGESEAGPEADGRTLWMKDPQGHIFGLREATSETGLTPDSLASDVWADGNAEPPPFGLPSGGVQDMAGVRLVVPDVHQAARFYLENVGLDLLAEHKSGRVVLYLGSTAFLELLPGEQTPDEPEDRTKVTDAFILRVYDYLGLRASMASAEAKTVETLERAGGFTDMVLDPSGHLFGFQERIAPDPDIPTSNLAEDIFARTRWLEH